MWAQYQRVIQESGRLLLRLTSSLPFPPPPAIHTAAEGGRLWRAAHLAENLRALAWYEARADDSMPGEDEPDPLLLASLLVIVLVVALVPALGWWQQLEF